MSLTQPKNPAVVMALDEVGTKESPANSNNVKYNTWYYGKAVSGSKYPWCMVFCLWIYNQVKAKLPGNSASCTRMMNDAKEKGCFITKGYEPGDLLLLDFQGYKSSPQHCGILRETDGINFYTIEGNTSVGNDSNGGEVLSRVRKSYQVVGAVRPIFSEEGGIDMTIDEFINKLTPEQAAKILEKAQTSIAAKPEPSWSAKEGYWKAATAKKIVDGTRPEDIIKRDEVIAILGRTGNL